MLYQDLLTSSPSIDTRHPPTKARNTVPNRMFGLQTFRLFCTQSPDKCSQSRGASRPTAEEEDVEKLKWGGYKGRHIGGRRNYKVGTASVYICLQCCSLGWASNCLQNLTAPEHLVWNQLFALGGFG